jgi:hypothetical protein
LLEDLEFNFIGNIDADISVDCSYFEKLVDHFSRRPKLGLAAGFIHEEEDGQFRSRSANRIHSISHGAQLLRRECYQAIGGYAVFRYGGEDWYAEICAKMNGWEVEALPGLCIFHHRRTGAGTNLLRARFRLGRLEYSVGSDPLFETLKCMQRLAEKPFVIGSLTRLLGFFWSSVCRDTRPVSSEFVTFLRKEQKFKVLSFLRGFRRQEILPAHAHYNPHRQ